MKNLLRSLAFTPALLVFTASFATGEPRTPELKRGMNSGDVIKLWGPPAEREEHEVKRRDIWVYPKGARVVFSESKVVEWKVGVNPIAEPAAAHSVSAAPEINTSFNPDTRDLVREIAKEVPSGPDVPYSDAPEPPNPGINAVPNPMPGQIPNPGGFNNPGVPQPFAADEE